MKNMRLEEFTVSIISPQKRRFLPRADWPEPVVVTLSWPDERAATAVIDTLPILKAVLRHYKLRGISPPLRSENSQFIFHYPSTEFPGILTIERKPQSEVQAYAWHYASETNMARIQFRDDELGVYFRDEEQFIPFSRLRYDPNTGFIIV